MFGIFWNFKGGRPFCRASVPGTGQQRTRGALPQLWLSRPEAQLSPRPPPSPCSSPTSHVPDSSTCSRAGVGLGKGGQVYRDISPPLGEI